jgi:AAA domain
MALRDDRGMGVIILAHSEIHRFEAPDTEPYDRYQPKLHKGASAILQEAMDCVLFCNYRVNTVKTDAGFNKRIVRGVGSGERLIYTVERPAFLAKNRWSLPDSLPLSWNAYASGIPYYASQQVSIAAE